MLDDLARTAHDAWVLDVFGVDPKSYAASASGAGGSAIGFDATSLAERMSYPAPDPTPAPPPSDKADPPAPLPDTDPEPAADPDPDLAPDADPYDDTDDLTDPCGASAMPPPGRNPLNASASA